MTLISNCSTKKWIDWQLDKFFELSFLQTYGQKIEGIYSGGCRYWWEELASHWLCEPIDEASQDIIVRVANDQIIQNSLWAISHNPVSQLVSNREMVEASRVQELDSSCLRWMGQKPGVTLIQKAAMSRRLLALRRTHSFDNLENRIFMYVLKILIKRAISYLDLNKSFCTSERFKQVESLLSKLNRMKATTPCVLITPLIPTLSLTPNNCLLYDSNYSQIWSLYRQLLKIEQIKEAAQMYQHTLWRETARQFVGALLSSPESPFQCYARSCVYFKRDMHEGRWTQKPNPPGPFFWNKQNILIYDVWDEHLPSYESAILNKLNADQLLVVQQANKSKIVLAIWYHHRTFEELGEAGEFIKLCQSTLKIVAQNSQSLVRGLIISSSIPGSDISLALHNNQNEPLAYFKLPLAPTPSYGKLSRVFFQTLTHMLEIA